MSGTGTVVGVTGASGFVGSWLVKLLLERGYTVNASLRVPDDPVKREHLLALAAVAGAKDRLQLFKADLMDFGSFDSCIAGCAAVFHTASPFKNDQDVEDPQAELLGPAVEGTRNVLCSVARHSSVKRVVLTSSTAAVTNNGKPRTPEVVVDETWFSDPDFCRESKMWYALSKTLAEKAAWDFAKKIGIDMVTINPSAVIGPLLHPTLNESARLIRNLIKGETTTYPNSTFGWVHVKDVAEAHIRAFENQSAKGRYCLVESVAHYSDIVDILRELYPHRLLPYKCADDKPLVPRFQVSKERAKGLGIDYIPLKDGLRDIVESLKAKGHFRE